MSHGLIEQLTSLIKYLVDYPQGLSILLGRASPPSCEEINGMLESARQSSEATLDAKGKPMKVSGGGRIYFEADQFVDNEEKFNRIIERVGGWEHVNEVVTGWVREHKNAWAIIVECSRNTRSRLDEVSYSSLAVKLGTSRDTIYQTIKDFPQRLAIAIMNTPIGDEFDLSPTQDKKAV